MCECGSDFVPLAEAALLLDATEIQVLMMLEKKELQGIMVDDAWHVDRSSMNLRGKSKVADIVSPGGCGICGIGCGSGC